MSVKILQIVNVLFVIINVAIFLAIPPKVTSIGGAGTSAAGFIVWASVFVLAAFIVHIVLLSIAFFYNKHSLLTGVSVVYVPLYILFWIFMYAPAIRQAIYNNQEEKRIALYNQGIGVVESGIPTEFTKAIAHNDSLKVAELIAKGGPVKNEYLAYSIDLSFFKDQPVSLSIFKLLIDNGADPNYKIPQTATTPVGICCGYLKTPLSAPLLELLLKAGASPLIESYPYHKKLPLTYLSNLQLLVKYGADVNTKTIVDYDPIDYLPSYKWAETPDDPILWTPIMEYARNYPGYFKETIYLFNNGADIFHKDKYGVSLVEVLQKVLNDQKTYNKPIPSELTEFIEAVEQSMKKQ